MVSASARSEPRTSGADVLGTPVETSRLTEEGRRRREPGLGETRTTAPFRMDQEGRYRRAERNPAVDSAVRADSTGVFGTIWGIGAYALPRLTRNHTVA